MNENETKQNPTNEAPVSNETESPVQNESNVKPKKGGSRLFGYVAAILAVALILLGVLYLLEKDGRSSTGIFDALIEKQEASVVVAVVNGEEIVNGDLSTSIQQFSQSAAAQGVDTTTEEAQTEIRTQALEVLINTELLRQQAEVDGIVVTDEEATERLATIEEEVGGPEVLAERMAVLGVDEAQLQQDIREEIMIQRLLDAVFEEADTEASEEEIAAVYEQAGGEEAGLPPLEEVREQIVASIISSKEQQLVDEYIASLREGADISQE